MKLSIYSLKKILFQGDIKLLNCKTAVGEITVLEHHSPLLGIIKQGVMKIVDLSGQENFFPVKSGIIEVRSNNETRCLVEE